MSEPWRLGLVEAVESMRSRRLSAVELIASCLERIDAVNGGAPTFDGAPDAINAWSRIYGEAAHAAAAAVDRAADGRALAGVPIGLKDMIAAAGYPLTASSRVLVGRVAERDSVAWARLRERGGILLGHTHTQEFALGASCPQVGNPWDTSRLAGGSSGGSAAAVAAGMVPVALGTDTAGSVRIPAALTGTTAIKPTAGSVPRDGVIPLAQSLDSIGVIARSVADALVVLEALTADGGEVVPFAGPACGPAALPRAPLSGAHPLRGMRIATTAARCEEADPEVRGGYERALEALRTLGAEIVEPPGAPSAPHAFYDRVFGPELVAAHRRYEADQQRYGIDTAEALDRYRASIDAVDYLEAQAERVRLTAAWESWFEDTGAVALVEPTVLCVAQPRQGAVGNAGSITGPLVALTEMWSLTGFPVISIPCGLGPRSGLPVGVSLVAPRGHDAQLAGIAMTLQEQELPPLRSR